MIHVKVLQHHIDLGVRKNAFHCAVALAIKEQYPEMGVVSVGVSLYADHKYRGAIPPEAMEFISAFDRNRMVEPFEFDIDEDI
jgi:hypothetical protein